MGGLRAPSLPSPLSSSQSAFIVYLKRECFIVQITPSLSLFSYCTFRNWGVTFVQFRRCQYTQQNHFYHILIRPSCTLRVLTNFFYPTKSSR